MPAGRHRGRARVGSSGWVYKDWRGLVYPEKLPQRRWFEHYATLFDTVEINNTFYRLPPVGTVDTWAQQAPTGFVYALKLGAFGSHRMKLRDAQSWLPNHLDRAERLGPSLGPTLVQLPPHWKRNVERLDEFLSVAPRRVALGYRVAGTLLASRRRVRCPTAPWRRPLPARPASQAPRILTADWTYARFHGPQALDQPYVGRYGSQGLRTIAARLSTWLDEGCDVYAYFNNDYQGDAVADGQWLQSRLVD